MLGETYELSFEELDTRHEHHDPAEMWELFRTSDGPSHGVPTLDQYKGWMLVRAERSTSGRPN
jgi:hypothetical protein